QPGHIEFLAGLNDRPSMCGIWMRALESWCRANSANFVIDEDEVLLPIGDDGPHLVGLEVAQFGQHGNRYRRRILRLWHRLRHRLWLWRPAGLIWLQIRRDVVVQLVCQRLDDLEGAGLAGADREFLMPD